MDIRSAQILDARLWMRPFYNETEPFTMDLIEFELEDMLTVYPSFGELTLAVINWEGSCIGVGGLYVKDFTYFIRENHANSDAFESQFLTVASWDVASIGIDHQILNAICALYGIERMRDIMNRDNALF
jgi:hypothetical protein